MVGSLVVEVPRRWRRRKTPLKVSSKLLALASPLCDKTPSEKKETHFGTLPLQLLGPKEAINPSRTFKLLALAFVAKSVNAAQKWGKRFTALALLCFDSFSLGTIFFLSLQGLFWVEEGRKGVLCCIEAAILAHRCC